MIRFCQNLLTASIHGSVVILAVMLLRLLLKKTPRKYICFLWIHPAACHLLSAGMDCMGMRCRTDCGRKSTCLSAAAKAGQGCCEGTGRL